MVSNLFLCLALTAPRRKGQVMKIVWKFADGTVSEVEVQGEIASFIQDSRRHEESSSRKERRHCLSLDSIDYEGSEYGYEEIDKLIASEETAEIRAALDHLSEKQRRRLLMYANGLSYQKIAVIESADVKSIYESVEGARKKFKKFYKNTPTKS